MSKTYDIVEYDMIVIDKTGEIKGKAIIDEELPCENEGCNGTQYVVYWEDGTVTIVCGKGLKWLDENTAQIDNSMGGC